jgi:hypothetical protein
MRLVHESGWDLNKSITGLSGSFSPAQMTVPAKPVARETMGLFDEAAEAFRRRHKGLI